jgi:Leucine Rich repeat
VQDSRVKLEGICELNLTGNQLNDLTIQELCPYLQYDVKTRSINLRFNKIGVEGFLELNALLDSNENLISLDIRNNPGMSPSQLDY